jgi:hypothetical protein
MIIGTRSGNAGAALERLNARLVDEDSVNERGRQPDDLF